MTKLLLCLPVEQWPEIDRARWSWAEEPAGFLEGDKPASHWSAGRRGIGEAACGRFLSFLERNQVLDPHSTPGDRATEDRLRECVTELQDRMAPVSAAMTIGALLRMLVVLEPERDWTLLGQVYKHLKRTAKPSRDSCRAWFRRPTCSPWTSGSWTPERISDVSRCTIRPSSTTA